MYGAAPVPSPPSSMHTTEPTSDDLAHAVEEVTRGQLDMALSDAVASLASPLDQSLRRANPRQRHSGPGLFDVEAMTIPNMAFSPEQITSLPEFDDLDGYGVQLAVDALKVLQDVVKNIITAREAYRGDVTLTEPAQVLAVDDVHGRLMPTATKRLDAAATTIGKAIEMHEEELRKGFTSSGPFASEIRAHCKSLSTGERMQFLNAAIGASDMVTLGACLGAPSYLSGLDPKMATTLTERANHVRSPLTAQRLSLLRGAQAKLEAAGGIALTSYEELVGARESTIRHLRERRQKTRTVLGAIVPAA